MSSREQSDFEIVTKGVRRKVTILEYVTPDDVMGVYVNGYVQVKLGLLGKLDSPIDRDTRLELVLPRRIQ